MSTKTTTKTKSEAQINIDMLSAALKRLHDKREEWQANAYKRSNEQLYTILEDCHTLLVQLRGEVKLRKKLNDAIKAAGFTVRSNTSIELKVVRAVFGIENNRIYAYVRVLQIAKAELPKGWTLSDWIEERGGIEEVRRTPKAGISAADQAEQYRSIAEAKLANADHIGERFDPPADLQPNDGGDYSFSVALVRVDTDGKASLVFGTNNNAIVKAVITEAGKQLSKQDADDAAVNKHSKKRQERDQILDGLGLSDDDLAIAA